MNTYTNYDITNKGGVRTVTADGLSFIGTRLETSAIGDVIDVLRGQKKCEECVLDGDRKILEFSGNLWIIEYTDRELRDQDKELLNSHFKPDGALCVLEKDGSQVPKVDFSLDANGKYYLLVNALHKINNNTLPDKGIYKGVVCDPQKQFAIKSVTTNVQLQTGNIF